MFSCETSRPRPEPAISRGMASHRPEIGPGHERDQGQHADRQQPESDPDDAACAAFCAPPPGQDRDSEHAQRQRRQRQPGLERVVLEDHLEVDRQGDHRPAQGDLLKTLLGDPEAEDLRREQVRVDQWQLALALLADEPAGQRHERDCADDDEGEDRLAALLPDEDPQHQPAHSDHGQDRPDDVDAARPGEGHVLERPDADEDDHDDDDLEGEADPPGQEGRDEPAEERPDRGGDRGRGTDQGVGLLLGGALEVAVDQGLHRGQEERRAEPAQDRPEDDDRPEVLGEGHRQGPDPVAQEAQDVGLLAPDQVTDLAADQDERGRDEGLEGDRRLDSADGRIQVPDDGRDRDVHQRGVDDQDEHRHGQDHREPWATLGRLRMAGDCRTRQPAASLAARTLLPQFRPEYARSNGPAAIDLRSAEAARAPSRSRARFERDPDGKPRASTRLRPARP